MPSCRSKLRACASGALALLAILLGCALASARADDALPTGQGVEVAVELPLSGDHANDGQVVLDGIRLAIDEANATGAGP